MSKFISILLIVVLLLATAFSFSACSDSDDETTPTVQTIGETTTTEPAEEYETVYVIVTNADGETVTDENGQAKTEVSKVEKTKKTTVTYEVMGGTDPYVVDIF